MARPKTIKSFYPVEYKAWTGMQFRCSDSRRENFHRYGGRGIAVCQRWIDSFEDFLADVGPKPDPSFTLERIDNNLGYEPGNVRWASATDNHRNKISNRPITLLGETKLLCEWAEEIGISKNALRWRVDESGWSEEDIVTKPLRPWPGPRVSQKQRSEKR